jgi:homocitrate synthase NifV
MANFYEDGLIFVDSTLRDGAQSPGLVLSYDHRLEIAQLLVSIGITDIEAGIPAMGIQEVRFLSHLNRLYPKQRIIAWCRAVDTDLHDAQRAHCRHVHIAFPVSDIHLDAIGKDRLWLFSTLERMVDSAKKEFEFVSVGAMDASRTSGSVVSHFCKTADLCGAHRIRIADTLGILSPRKTTMLFDSLAKSIDPARLEFHGHNDLGMATANALCAAEAGVGALSATVNGIGERAGNVALEEIVIALKINQIRMQYIQTGGIQYLCDRVARLTNCQIPFSKPVTGKGVFLHESGMHWKALLIDKHTYEPFSPALTGHTESMPVAGTHSGGATVRALMAKQGVYLSDNESKKVAEIIRRKVHSMGRPLTDREVETVCEKHFGLLV